MAKKTPKPRCWWCGDDPLYIEYHDFEWGRPVRDDRKLFEMLLLEGFQAGLSWITILKKRENFRKAFAGFNPQKISKFTSRDISRLMNDAGIIRNRAKIQSAVSNAKAFLEVQREFGSFSKFIWSFTGDRTLRKSRGPTKDTIPAKSKEAEKISKVLKSRGFKFVGPTIIYSHMQATGMVDDHVVGCWRYKRR